MYQDGGFVCMVFFLPHLSELLYLLRIPHLHENRPIVASSSVLLGVWMCCCNTSNGCSYSWQYVLLTKSVESFSKSFFQNALELYWKLWQLGKLQSVMDSYYDKSCDICAQTVTLLAYDLFRARSTRIRRFLNPKYFLCRFGLRPHVSGVSRIRILTFLILSSEWKFLNTLCRSRIFWTPNPDILFYPVTPHYLALFFTVNIQDGAERNVFASLLLWL